MIYNVDTLVIYSLVTDYIHGGRRDFTSMKGVPSACKLKEFANKTGKNAR